MQLDKSSATKPLFIVHLDGVFGHSKSLKLSKTHFDLLKKFADNRLSKTSDWLEIKPKNETRSNKTYDIKDYNEIKRMLHALLDGLLGKGLWTKEHHEQPLKNLLIERSPDRERKVRLALSEKNITLDC